MRRVSPIMLLALAAGLVSAPACEITEIDVELVPEGEAPLLPPGPPPPARPRIRMNLDQLEAALVQVSGGVRWEADFRGHPFSQFDLRHLGRTLGKADYFQRTEDDLSPGVVFQKFLDDAARHTCGEMVARDAATRDGQDVEPPLAAPILVPAEGVDPDAHMAGLLARFHSRLVAPDDPALDPWRTLVQRVGEAGADGPTTWRAVCVALITHPDFYLF